MEVTSMLKTASLLKEAQDWKVRLDQLCRLERRPLDKLAKLLKEPDLARFLTDFHYYLEYAADNADDPAFYKETYTNPNGFAEKVFSPKRFLQLVKEHFGLQRVSVKPPQRFSAQFFRDFLEHLPQYEVASRKNPEVTWQTIFPSEDYAQKAEWLSQLAPEDAKGHGYDPNRNLDDNDRRTYDVAQDDPIFTEWLAKNNYKTDPEMPLAALYKAYLLSGMYPKLLSLSVEQLKEMAQSYNARDNDTPQPMHRCPWCGEMHPLVDMFIWEPSGDENGTYICKGCREQFATDGTLSMSDTRRPRTVEGVDPQEAINHNDISSWFDAPEYSPPFPVTVKRKDNATGEVTEEPYWVVNIPTLEQAHVEGEKMQNCLRWNYDHAIPRGTSRIFSLRDIHNNPHVSIELDPTDDSIEQAYAKQNTPARGPYLKAVKSWWEHHGYEPNFDTDGADLEDEEIDDILTRADQQFLRYGYGGRELVHIDEENDNAGRNYINRAYGLLRGGAMGQTMDRIQATGNGLFLMEDFADDLVNENFRERRGDGDDYYEDYGCYILDALFRHLDEKPEAYRDAVMKRLSDYIRHYANAAFDHPNEDDRLRDFWSLAYPVLEWTVEKQLAGALPEDTYGVGDLVSKIQDALGTDYRSYDARHPASDQYDEEALETISYFTHDLLTVLPDMVRKALHKAHQEGTGAEVYPRLVQMERDLERELHNYDGEETEGYEDVTDPETGEVTEEWTTVPGYSPYRSLYAGSKQWNDNTLGGEPLGEGDPGYWERQEQYGMSHLETPEVLSGLYTRFLAAPFKHLFQAVEALFSKWQASQFMVHQTPFARTEPLTLTGDPEHDREAGAVAGRLEHFTNRDFGQTGQNVDYAYDPQERQWYVKQWKQEGHGRVGAYYPTRTPYGSDKVAPDDPGNYAARLVRALVLILDTPQGQRYPKRPNILASLGKDPGYEQLELPYTQEDIMALHAPAESMDPTPYGLSWGGPNGGGTYADPQNRYTVNERGQKHWYDPERKRWFNLDDPNAPSFASQEQAVA